MPKNRRRTRKGKNRSTPVNSVGTGRQLVPVSPASQSGQRPNSSRRRNPRSRNNARRGLNMLSPQGLAFLKCATSPPDFQSDPGRGIPDSFEGRILPIKHASTVSQDFARGRDTYLVFPPIPGVMLCSSVVGIGEYPHTFQATYHNDAMVDGFDEFRFASTCVGIYPTSNFSQFGGSITVYKTMMSIGSDPNDAIMALEGTAGAARVTTAHVDVPYVRGADFGPVSPSANFSAPFIDGCYSQSFNMAPNFQFTNAGHFTELANYPRRAVDAKVPEMRGNEKTFFFSGKPIVGLGTLETIIVKITTPAGVTNSAIIKSWQCLEVIPGSNTPMYKFLGYSPPLDPIAMAIYRKIANEIPIAVVAKMNASSWDRISQMIVNMLKAGSYLPGPAGVISSGLSMAMAGIRDMTI